MIEVLPNIFYDPSKEWYEQPVELIDLGLEVQSTDTIDSAVESSGNHERFIFQSWQLTTEMGSFLFRVDYIYMNSIEHRAFLNKKEHSKITVTRNG